MRGLLHDRSVGLLKRNDREEPSRVSGRSIGKKKLWERRKVYVTFLPAFIPTGCAKIAFRQVVRVFLSEKSPAARIAYPRSQAVE